MNRETIIEFLGITEDIYDSLSFDLLEELDNCKDIADLHVLGFKVIANLVSNNKDLRS